MHPVSSPLDSIDQLNFACTLYTYLFVYIMHTYSFSSVNKILLLLINNNYMSIFKYHTSPINLQV